VARASLEELRLDYEDFLRHRRLNEWDHKDPRRQDILKQGFSSADQFARWVKAQKGELSEVAANGVLILLQVTCVLLDRQIAAQAAAFEREGGFTERLYRCRLEARNNSKQH
jgi:four helix bundle suffix protein